MNYKKIQAVVKHQFEWEKHYFFLVIIMMVIMKCVFVFVNSSPLVLILGMAITFVPLFFLKAEFRGKLCGFSAKYLLTFPLTRKELFISQILVNLFTISPMILWIVLFYDYTDSILFFNSTSTAAFVVFSSIFFTSSIFSLQLLAFARGVSIKADARENNFVFFTLVAHLLLISFAVYCLVFYFERQHGIDILFYLNKIIDFVIIMFQTKWLGLAILFFSFLLFFEFKKISSQDKFSFRKPLNIKKDLFYLGGTVVFTAACLLLAKNTIPQIFQGELQSAVFKKDYKKIESLISSGININKPNQFGLTPMMAAVFQGHLDIVKNFEAKGAHYQGEINKKSEKYYGYDVRILAATNNDVKLMEYIQEKVPSFNVSNSLKTIYPIHVAANRCHNKVVDYLISKGVDIEAKTEKGLTPIVIAARNNCFEAVISLKDAGARFDIKDEKGKLALNELGKNIRPEMKIFIEKNMRMPASK